MSNDRPDGTSSCVKCAGCLTHSPSMGEIRSDLLMDCSSSVGMTVRPLSITPVTGQGGVERGRGGFGGSVAGKGRSAHTHTAAR